MNFHEQSTVCFDYVLLYNNQNKQDEKWDVEKAEYLIMFLSKPGQHSESMYGIVVDI